MTLPYVLIGIVTFLASLGATAWLCARPTFLVPLDCPNGRSLHDVPTPRTGGVAVLGGLLLGLLCAAVVHGLGFDLGFEQTAGGLVSTLWVLVASMLLGAVSYLDDHHRLSLGARLAAHGLAAVGLVLGLGLQITEIPIPTMGSLELGWFAAPFSILFLMWMSNLYNFMDGMDGFAGGMTVIGFGCLGGLALAGGPPILALTAWCIVAATAGFLVFNLPPARIFMGDIGSIPLGFLAGSLSLVGIRHAVFDPWVPALIFSPFIVDATVTLIRRALRGAKVWQAHREHFYQRVVLAGWGHRNTVRAEYVLMLIMGFVALAYAQANEHHRVLLLGGGLCGFLSLAVSVSALERGAGHGERKGLMTQMLKYRRPLVGALHVGLIILANYLAFWLRFDGDIPEPQWAVFVGLLPWLVVIRGLMFMPFRLYEGLWRYTGIWDLRNIIGGVLCSTGLFYLIVQWGLGLGEYPRSVFLIDALVLLVCLSGIRLTRRILREVWHVDRGKRLLIYGAGDVGATLVPELLNDAKTDYVPVGFVSDDPLIVGQRINGVKVLGTKETLLQIVAEKRPDAVLVAVPEGSQRLIRELVRMLEPYKVRLITQPTLRDVLAGRVEINRMRDLSIEDLLDRAPVGLDRQPVKQLIGGKRVLVTGAGGSIGSELCRQIEGLNPASLILLDRYENGLFQIMSELEARRGGVALYPVIGDVTDSARINAILREHRPQIVFHAAAHKHVPMMEGNPCEAVKNNVLGTRTMVEASERYLAERFILISTDKAVNPCNVMGATKRVAEFLVQRMNHSSRCIFSAVRFGNVLGSNGSVVPRFLEQIKQGGPVTVTHPDVRRYFMLIPEAVQLVLHAAALAEGGDIYVLEMGEQIKLVDMARNLIRLSGHVPDDEIPITFVGLRPGEKLSEELVEETEKVDESGVQHIMKISSAALPDPTLIRSKVLELERYAMLGHTKSVLTALRELIPGYRPTGMEGAESAPVSFDTPAPSLPKSLSYAELGTQLSGRS
jgi:FlaA1/EpsC-like NDP-sugar epimerase/UDP-N-acetylmuramyl pentapeptide phosphotransferase/UDP-N-acetylglucosamine-1-phosphate transferase